MDNEFSTFSLGYAVALFVFALLLSLMAHVRHKKSLAMQQRLFEGLERGGEVQVRVAVALEKIANHFDKTEA